ncbi:hypothetical protein TNCV_1806751 [Trichonephila clavipes]|nr:hypothetical protein TNCV_1806751 [Trichonephila clavipes]
MCYLHGPYKTFRDVKIHASKLRLLACRRSSNCNDLLSNMKTQRSAMSLKRLLPDTILTCREKSSSGRFIQERGTLNLPLPSSLETSSISSFTLSGVVPYPRVLIIKIIISAACSVFLLNRTELFFHLKAIACSFFWSRKLTRVKYVISSSLVPLQIHRAEEADASKKCRGSNNLPLVWSWERERASSGVSSSSLDYDSKLRGLSPKSHE